MKLSIEVITKSDDNVSFVFNTRYITDALLIVLILLGSFIIVWSLALPSFFYDIAVTIIVTIKLYKFILKGRKKKS
jgi:hypothetical protein